MTKHATLMPTLLSTSLLFMATQSFSAYSRETQQPLPEAVKRAADKLELQIDYAEASPIEGYLQVMTDRGLIYFSQDGATMLHGNIYALGEQPANLTQKAIEHARKKGVAERKETLLSYPADNEQYRVTVFTDTSCGYCRQLHNQIEDYNKLGITIQYMAYPRAGLNSPSATELAGIWCDKSPQKAMNKAQSGQAQQLTDQGCQKQVADQFNFGRKVGVDRTPSLILASGELLMGYRPPAQLLSVLKAKAAPAKP